MSLYPKSLPDNSVLTAARFACSRMVIPVLEGYTRVLWLASLEEGANQRHVKARSLTSRNLSFRQ